MMVVITGSLGCSRIKGMGKNKISLNKLKRLFNRKFPEGYCDGFNWATCSSKHTILPEGSVLLKGSINCPYLKYNTPCYEEGLV
jgi:hypothetical protein